MGNEQTTEDAATTYSKLINMGFAEAISLEASHKYPDPNNLNKAINYVMKSQLKEKASAYDHGIDPTDQKLDNVVCLKEGWLQKKWRYTGFWSKIWCVIDGEHLLIFKTQNISEKPIALIPLSSIIDVVSANSMFYIQMQGHKHCLRTDTEFEKTEWMDIINKYKNNCIRTSVFVECDRDNEFNDDFKLVIPYNGSNTYSIRDLVDDIMKYVQQKHLPLKLIPTKIKPHSFVRKMMNCNEINDDNITDYAEASIQEFGVYLAIDIKQKCLDIAELMIYFETIKTKYDTSQKNKKNYSEILSSLTQQIIQNITFLQKPLNLNMLHFLFVNGFLRKDQFNIIVRELSADQLSKLIKNIGNKQLSKFIFDIKNEEMLSHYNIKDLFNLLKKHYSDPFAVFVFEQMKPNFLKSKISQRKEYLTIVSIEMMLWIYDHNDIGTHLHIDELKYLFSRMKNDIKCLRTLSYVSRQIIEQNAEFITLDPDNLYFAFTNDLIETKRLSRELTAGDLSKLLKKVNDITVEKRIFEDENEQILSHYHHNHLMQLLKEFYSDTFAIFVFKQFEPTFLECSLSERIRYLNIVSVRSVDVLIWMYQYNNVGKRLHITELQYLFKVLQVYASSHHRKHLQILKDITMQIAEKNAPFLALDAENFHFVFYNQLIETKSIVSGLKADDLSKAIKNIDDKNITKHIFESKPNECLRYYNQNDLIELLKVYYSESFAIFVFNQFSPSFLEYSQRKKYLENISITMRIWVFNNNDIGRHLNINESIFYFATFKTYVTSHHKDDNKQHWNILSCVMQQIIKQRPQFIAQKTNLHFIFLNRLITVENVNEIQIIIRNLDVNALSTLLSTINDKNIEQLIFEKRQKQMLSHYSTNDAIQLLEKYYSNSFARFVFAQFQPNFLKSQLSQRQQYLKIVSIDVMIWMYNKDNTGKHLHIDESIYYFKTMNKYVTSQQSNRNKSNKCLQILKSATEQIIKKNVTFITSDTNNLYFVFWNNLVKQNQMGAIVSQLTANRLSTLIKTINNGELSKYIFEDANKKLLSHYNNNDLIQLLQKHYSHLFAIFVFGRFNSFSNQQRTEYLKMISIDMMIWILDKKYGQNIHASNSEISIFVNKIKGSISKDQIKMNKCSYLCKKVITEKGWINEIVIDDLQIFVIYELVSKLETKFITNELLKRHKINMKKCEKLLCEKQAIEMQNVALTANMYDLKVDHLRQIQILKTKIQRKNRIIKNINKQTKIYKFKDVIGYNSENKAKRLNGYYTILFSNETLHINDNDNDDVKDNFSLLSFEKDAATRFEAITRCDALLDENRRLKNKKNEVEEQNIQLKSNIYYLQKEHSQQIQLLDRHSGEMDECKSEESLSYVTIWQWHDYAANWKSYDHEINEQIEKLAIGEHYQFCCTANDQNYKIAKSSLNGGVQKNTKTGVARKIRKQRIEKGTNFIKYPIWWNMDGFNDYGTYAKPKLIELDLTTYPATNVINSFYETVDGYTITKIESIENQMLFDAYWNVRSKLSKLIGDYKLNQRELYHGTGSNAVMELIRKEGFRKEFNNRSRYGKGTYFARDANYSVGTYSSESNGVHKIFQCKVICGESCIGSNAFALTKWPKKSDGSGLIYDSLVDKSYDPTIFVIHEDARAYPMFVIHFMKNSL